MKYIYLNTGSLCSVGSALESIITRQVTLWESITSEAERLQKKAGMAQIGILNDDPG